MMRAFFTVLFWTALSATAAAQQPPAPTVCPGTDKPCLFKELMQAADAIEEAKWRDISYRELSKSLAVDGRFDDAMAIIAKIKSGDTQALTIRGIGMAAADHKLDSDAYALLFKKLAALADSIPDTPSKDIAYTYIAMSQSYALQDEAALATARAMTNPALRHKALGEIAEVQAQRKDAVSALRTLSQIDSPAYRNKASRTVTLLLSDQSMFDEATKAASGIANPTLKAEALQYIISKQQASK